MHKLRLYITALALITFAFGVTVTGQSLLPRTFVSGVGSDTNPCTRTAPCKTFSGALGKTAINGEINCLDPGGFGVVLITKSVTIDCEDQQGSILAGPGSTGVEIDLRSFSPGDPRRFVRLRGLTINGSGPMNGASTRAGFRGIVVTNGNTAPTTLHVEQVVVDNFAQEGILFNGLGGELMVRNSVIQNNGTIGVMVDSTTGDIVKAKLENSSFLHNQQGIRAETAARISATNCNFSNNSLNGVVVFTVDATQSEINLFNCLIASNRQWGVVAIAGPGPAIIRLDGNHIVNNTGVAGAAGVQIQTNGQVFSRGNNTISGNTVDVQGGTLGSIPNQ